MAEEPGAPPPAEGADEEGEERTVGELVLDVSERVGVLIREEVELAKAEISEKVGKIARGSIAGAAAVLFVVIAFTMLMHSFAWLLNDLLFEHDAWAGFLVSAVIWLILAAIAALFAYRSVRAGAPPTPQMAIEEAKRTKETLGVGE